MRNNLQSITRGFAAAFMVFATMSPMLSPAYAAAGGNNGTLKVHEIGTPSGTENNDPKVCAFNFEGFGFDQSQSGYITIDPQGGSSPVGVGAGPFSFGPTDANGYAVSQDFNTVGGTTIVNGTYKAMLYGKDAAGNVNLTDEKAKSKVFKVDCETTDGDIAIPASAPAFVDVDCNNDGSYTLPETTGVTYKVNGVAVGPGVYTVSSPTTIAITAEAALGYILDGPFSWNHNFTAPEGCEVPPDPEDLCPNIEGTQAQVPAGMAIDENGDCVTPGQGGGDPTDPSDPTDPTDPGNVVALATSTPSIAPVNTVIPQTLPETGSSVLFNMLLALFAGLTAMAISRYGNTIQAAKKE